jgi:hypothetical protein
MHAGNLPPHHFEGIQPITPDQHAQGYSLGGYYFVDETEAHVIGPYAYYEVAVEAQKGYAKYLNDGTSAPDLTTVIERSQQEEAFNVAFTEIFGSPATFSGRYCQICEDTTPHAVIRGKFRKETKVIPPFCMPCLLPGGALYRIVEKSLPKSRQGDSAQ